VPLYEYECRACGYQFEQLVRGTVTPACPACTSENLARVFSAFAVSSESSRSAALQSARRKAAVNPDRIERRRAEAEHTVEHLREDYGITPAKVKPGP
jgi:putative FmdB family regulatory protein